MFLVFEIRILNIRYCLEFRISCFGFLEIKQFLLLNGAVVLKGLQGAFVARLPRYGLGLCRDERHRRSPPAQSLVRRAGYFLADS